MNVMLPRGVPEALDMLASDGAAIPMAGGTDLLVHWPVHVEAHEHLFREALGRRKTNSGVT